MKTAKPRKAIPNQATSANKSHIGKREVERAHVTVDSGMGRFYEWFVKSDPRYRAREFVTLARLGFSEMERREAEPKAYAPESILSATSSSAVSDGPADRAARASRLNP